MSGKTLNASLIGFVNAALDDAANSLKSGIDPVAPFAMTWDTDGIPSVRRCFSDDYHDAVKLAVEVAEGKADDSKAYCVAWSGYVTRANERHDAILVEGGEKGDEKAVLMAMLYRSRTNETPFEEIGNVMLLEYRKNLLHPR